MTTLVTQTPGAEGTAGVHQDVKSDGAYNLSPDGTVATPVMTQNIQTSVKVLRMQTYAAELECSEKDTRHWIHRWCVEKNGGQMAVIPPILNGTGLQPTVPNCMVMAAQKHAQRNCMGLRPIYKCEVEGKKQFWQKGPFQWRNYGEVFGDVQAAAKGLYQLPGIGDKRVAKKQVVAALLEGGSNPKIGRAHV